MTSRRLALALLAASSVFVLAACAPETGTGPTAAAEQGPTPTPEATKQPTPAETAPSDQTRGSDTVELPQTCDELIPPAKVAEINPDVVLGTPEEATSQVEWLIGPSTREALSGGEQRLSCYWGNPDADYIVTVSVALLSTLDSVELLTALRASDYVETATGQPDSFVFDHQPSEGTQVQVILDGPVLIAAGDNQAEDRFTYAALSTIRSMNPGLAQ